MKTLLVFLAAIFLFNGCAIKDSYRFGWGVVKESYKDYPQDALEALNPYSIVGTKNLSLGDHLTAWIFYPLVMPVRVTAPVLSLALLPASPIVYYLPVAAMTCTYQSSSSKKEIDRKKRAADSSAGRGANA